MKVAVNDFISDRGMSGSAVGGKAIVTALRSASHDCATIMPCGYQQGRRLSNMLKMISWDLHRASGAAVAADSDVMVNLANTGVGWNIPTINVLHDTMVLDHPSMFERPYRAYATMTFGPSVRRAAINVVPSQYSKSRALRRWPDAKYQVIPWYSRNQRVSQYQSTPASLNILSIASADKHKRLPMLVSAVTQARKILGEDLTLTLIARSGNDMRSIRTLADSGMYPWLILECEYVEDSRLQNLVDSSLCVASSSIDEGFCLPLLEAGMRGIPVVHTSRGAMDEVITVNPGVTRGGPGDELLIINQIVALFEDSMWAREAFRSWEASIKFNVCGFEASWAKVVEDAAGVR